MLGWTVETLNTTVDKEIEALLPKARAKFRNIARLLIEFGPRNVGKPYVKHIDGKLWEMRPDDGRIIYLLADGKRIVLLHAFTKKRNRIPKRNLKTARDRAEDFQEREARRKTKEG